MSIKKQTITRNLATQKYLVWQYKPLSFLGAAGTSTGAGLFKGGGATGRANWSESSFFLFALAIFSRCFLLLICIDHTPSLRTTDSHNMHTSCPLLVYVKFVKGNNEYIVIIASSILNTLGKIFSNS